MRLPSLVCALLSLAATYRATPETFRAVYDAAQAGDVLELAPGEYGEQKLSRPGVTIRGGYLARTFTRILIFPEAAGTTLHRLKVRGGSEGLHISASDVTLSLLDVRETIWHAALVTCAPGTFPCYENPPERVRFIGGVYGYSEKGNGIKWDFCSDCSIERARVAYCGNSGIQINVAAPGRFRITDNEIDHNGLTVLEGARWHAHGIYTGEPGDFHRNRVHHNGGWGVHVWPGPGPRTTPENPIDVRYNRVVRNGSGGVVIGPQPGSVSFWQNIVKDNGNDGLIP